MHDFHNFNIPIAVKNKLLNVCPPVSKKNILNKIHIYIKLCNLYSNSEDLYNKQLHKMEPVGTLKKYDLCSTQNTFTTRKQYGFELFGTMME